MFEGCPDDHDPARTATPPKVLAAVAVSRNSENSTATSSASSTPRVSLLPSSSLVPSQGVWGQSLSSPQLPMKPPLPRPWSSQSLPYPPSPGTPGSGRNFGALLPASSLAACPEPPRSLVGSALSTALASAEVLDGSHPTGSLPVPALVAHRLQALSEGQPLGEEATDQLKNAVAKLETVYAEELESSHAARKAAVSAQKEAEAEVAALRLKLEAEQRERQRELQAWHDEKMRLQLLLRAAIEELPPTAVPQSLRLASQTIGSLPCSSTSLTTSLVSSDHSALQASADVSARKHVPGAPDAEEGGSIVSEELLSPQSPLRDSPPR